MKKLAKKQIRDSVMEERDALATRARKKKSKNIHKHLFSLSQWPGRGAVLFFHTMKSEVFTPPMIQDALKAGIEVALPKMAGEGSLELRKIQEIKKDVEPNELGIPEPKESCPLVEASGIGIIIVPGVAFDSLGYRIGYGGGYYDRLLASTPWALRVAIAFDLQCVEPLPRKTRDIPVDILITEKGPKAFYRRLVPEDFPAP